MKISLSWLKELVDYNLTPRELADKLSLVSIGVKQTSDDFLELDLTYNRGDLLSLRGVAREVAAITNSTVTFKNNNSTYKQTDLPATPVKIEDEEFSPAQCVAKIEKLKFGPSPKEWVKKLKECGMRSVNNIADVTNLIMLEYGQPLHAFDESTVKDDTINVRLAKKDEEIITLDGKLRKLDQSDLVLADTEKPLDVAGVMGGKDTEVKESTHTILLSASMFNPTMVRKTAQRLGLHSEASKRFQHGLTKTNLLEALSAAIKMYESLGGKLTAISLVGDLEDKPKIIQLSKQKINSLLGVEIPAEQIKSSLQSLGFHPKGGGTNNWEVTVPYFRLDIQIEEDLIEEIARIYGYEKIEGKPLQDDSPIQLDETLAQFIYDLKLKLKKLGLTETQSYSFYSTAVLEALGIAREAKKTLIKIANPISSETEYLRLDLWPNLLEVIGKNIKEGFKDIGIFEIGKVYKLLRTESPQKTVIASDYKNENGKPQESYRLSIALLNNTDNPIEELYKLAENSILHLRGVKLNPSTPPKEAANLFHPKRFINIEKDGKMIAGIAEVHLRLLNKLGIENRVAVLEIGIEDLT